MSYWLPEGLLEYFSVCSRLSALLQGSFWSLPLKTSGPQECSPGGCQFDSGRGRRKRRAASSQGGCCRYHKPKGRFWEEPPLWMQWWHQEMWPPRLCSPLQNPGDHYKSSGTTGLRWQTTLQGTADEVQKHVGSFPNLPTQTGHQIQARHKSLQLFARGVRVLQQRHLSAPRVAKQWQEDAAQICLRSLAWKPWCIFVI